MNVIQVDVNSLKPYKNNPRNNDNAVSAVANSIREFGFKVPIVIDSDHVIVAGHTRLKAAQALGLSTVPCIVADDLTDEQIKAFRLADNKVGELAEWDIDLLIDELELLDSIDMSEFGFEEIGFEDESPAVENYEIPDNIDEIEPRSQRGDVFLLGKHRLMCGDATSQSDMNALMGDVVADLYLTDPPYGVNYTGGTAKALTIENDHLPSGEFREFLCSAFMCVDSHLKEGGAFYIWHANKESFNFYAACNDVEWSVRQVLIWVKNSLVLRRQDYHWKHEPCLYGWKDGAAHLWNSDRKQTTVLEFDRPTRNSEHPTMKPVDLFRYLIENSSLVGESVLDNFGGSGTTLIASELCGRVCYTMEIDPRYVDVIIDRWEALTGGVAVKLSNG